MSSAEPHLVVVDASVALLNAQPSLQLLAPDLVLVELLHAGWRTQRQRAITLDQFLAIGELAPGLFNELVWCRPPHCSHERSVGAVRWITRPWKPRPLRRV